MPATLTTEEMATELGLTVPQLLRAKDRGEVPQPAIKSRPYRWVRRQLEDVLAGKPVYAPKSDDPIMERINGIDFDALR